LVGSSHLPFVRETINGEADFEILKGWSAQLRHVVRARTLPVAAAWPMGGHGLFSFLAWRAYRSFPGRIEAPTPEQKVAQLVRCSATAYRFYESIQIEIDM
jgi:hypothetical protein